MRKTSSSRIRKVVETKGREADFKMLNAALEKLMAASEGQTNRCGAVKERKLRALRNLHLTGRRLGLTTVLSDVPKLIRELERKD